MKLFATGMVLAATLTAGDAPASWNEKAAAAYLDGRMAWWMAWPSAARDHETFCVSCHTAAPYAVGRSALRAALAEQGPTAMEQKLVDNVAKRVRMWKEVKPFYPDKPTADKTGIDPKTAESRGTESILNALVLTSYQAPDAAMALDNMWSEQLQIGAAKGAWNWLQFHNSPWEGDSQYYGATLAAIAAGNRGPADRVQLLREYLARERDSQVLINRVMLLWASTKVSGLLTKAEQKSIVTEALSKQQDDGGFSLSSFVGDWKRRDKTALETKSDGYATGIVMYVLQQAGVPRDQAQVKRGLTWLAQNQQKADGRWLAYSLNKERDLSTDVGKFMSDAATAYAVLALK